MVDIFISYSRVDRHFVQQLSGHLERIYETVWYDKSLHGGQDWWREILKRIATSEVLVYLLSPEAIRSRYCRAEYEEALRLNKCVIPVLIRPDMTLTPDIADLHVIDMSAGITVDNLLDLQAAIRFHLAHSATTLINRHLADTRPTPPPRPARPLLPSRRFSYLLALAGLLLGIVVGGVLGTLLQPLSAAASVLETATVVAAAPSTLTPFTLLLRYDSAAFVLPNTTHTPVDVSALRFVRSTPAGEVEFAARDWGSAALAVQGCLQLWTTEYSYLPPPDDCGTRLGWRQVIAQRWFWKGGDAVATFSVQRRGETLADCPVSLASTAAALECRVSLGTDG